MRLPWSTSLELEITSSRKLVERAFNREQCKSLFSVKPFSVGAEYKDLIQACLPTINIQATSPLQLDFKAVGQLRWQILSYLNRLESIMVAWEEGVADPDMIEKEFEPLSENSDNFILKTFRTACKEESNNQEPYPSIKAFEDKITKKEDPQQEKREIIKQFESILNRKIDELGEKQETFILSVEEYLKENYYNLPKEESIAKKNDILRAVLSDAAKAGTPIIVKESLKYFLPLLF